MPHVDEGQLHASLDGAYSAGDPELLAIRAHLRDCADCRNRLEEARTLRERAGEILGLATPLVDQAPPFDQVRAQRIPRHRSRFSHKGGLAWAATVVIALAAGWLARGMMPSFRYSQSHAMMQESAESRATAATANDAAPTTTDALQATPQPLPAPPAPPPAMATGTPAESDQMRPGESSLRSAPLADAATRQRSAIVTDSGRSNTPAPATGETMLSFQRPQLAITAETIDDIAPTDWQPSTMPEARQRYGPVLQVPELPVRSVAVARSGTSILVRVTQALPDGLPLELLHTIPAGEAAEGKARAGESVGRPTADATGAWLLTVERDGITVTARAPIRPDSLAALVERLRGE